MVFLAGKIFCNLPTHEMCLKCPKFLIMYLISHSHANGSLYGKLSMLLCSKRKGWPESVLKYIQLNKQENVDFCKQKITNNAKIRGQFWNKLSYNEVYE